MNPTRARRPWTYSCKCGWWWSYGWRTCAYCLTQPPEHEQRLKREAERGR